MYTIIKNPFVGIYLPYILYYRESKNIEQYAYFAYFDTKCVFIMKVGTEV